ncbi:uncharacterized protein LOC121998636 [Zingiber officinale]|uniref:uncharacterized protein LOC121998636 n=1 Tax=Zingiber officinale TaxID=94328 RepID=UPI001C4B1232|nr:uncharacterized protein LOC121998636 [Zingiber officinale]
MRISKSVKVSFSPEMANPGSSSRTRGRETLIGASKLGFLFLCILCVGAATRVAVPAAAEALAVAFPGYRAALRSWLAPPYLFVAVHLIIFVIWKLSDKKQQPREHWAAESRIVDFGNPKKSTFLGSPPVAGISVKPSPDISPLGTIPSSAAAVAASDPTERSPSDVSCLTTESDAVRVVSSAVINKRGVEEESKSSVKKVEEGYEAAAIANEAITGKTPRSPATPRHEEAKQPAAAPSPSATDEFNRRIDDFIKKNREQIRLLNGR